MAKSITKALRKLFPDTIVWEPFSSVDGLGNITYGTAVNRKARIVGQHKMVMDAQGQERMSNIIVWFAKPFDATAVDKYTLPSRFDPQTPKPITVEKYPDENGKHHVKVYF
jgi:hypothetical protein